MTAVWIVALAVGIPVLSNTFTRLAKLHYAQKEKDRDTRAQGESEALREIQAEMDGLKRRIANLESILLDLDNRRTGL